MDENKSLEIALGKLSLQENDVVVIKVDRDNSAIIKELQQVIMDQRTE